VKEVEGANAIIQELNEVIREKEELLEYKDEVISEQTVRLEELNLQLSECVAKWEREKENYLPTASKLAELSDEITRMNAFISDLDGRNKQLLEINKRKMQQGLESKPSISETLKELYVLMQKNKNKMLNRCQSEKERETVMGEFKAVQ
jgi:chromosome segregation ATPase